MVMLNVYPFFNLWLKTFAILVYLIEIQCCDRGNCFSAYYSFS